MTRYFLAALLAAGASSVQAQPSTPSVTIEASPDTAQERQALRILSACLARARPRWARHTLSLPYLSDAQAYAASRALSGKDSCVPRNGAVLTFRTSSMVGSLSDYFLRTEIRQVEMARLTSALARLAPLNASEDFALCVAARNPASARDLVLSDPGSAAEAQALRPFTSYIEICTAEREELTVDLQSLRALVSTALYRGVQAARN